MVADLHPRSVQPKSRIANGLEHFTKASFRLRQTPAHGQDPPNIFCSHEQVSSSSPDRLVERTYILNRGKNRVEKDRRVPRDRRQGRPR